MRYSFFRNLYSKSGQVFDIIFPPTCFITGERVESWGDVSPTYWKELRFIAYPYCDQCGVAFDFNEKPQQTVRLKCPDCLENQPAFDRSRAALKYDTHSRRLILPFKHADQTHLVHTIGRWMAQSGRELIESSDFLMPVPLHRSRLWRRRYNQSLIIANFLAKKFDKPVLIDDLLRIRATDPQGHKSKKDRRRNLKSAFALKPSSEGLIRGKTICLIDDVMTSGATLDECAAVLKAAGAEQVFTVTLARVC